MASHFVHFVELLSLKAALDVHRGLWLLLASSWAIAWTCMHSQCIEWRHRFPLSIDHFTGNRIQPQDLLYCIIRTSTNKSFCLFEKQSHTVFHVWSIPLPFRDSCEKKKKILFPRGQWEVTLYAANRIKLSRVIQKSQDWKSLNVDYLLLYSQHEHFEKLF